MKWWPFRRKQYDGTQKALQQVEVSRRNAEQSREIAAQAHVAAAQLRHLRKTNGFAEMVSDIYRTKHDGPDQ